MRDRRRRTGLGYGRVRGVVVEEEWRERGESAIYCW